VELAKDARHALAIGPFGSNLKVSDYRSSGVPLVFVRHIRSGEFDGPDLRYVDPVKAQELSAHQVEAGDLLVTKMGDPPGDCAIYPESRPRAVITADCIRFAVNPDKADRRLLALLFRTRFVKAQIDTRTKGVAQRKISLKTFRTIQFPLPESLSRQRELAASVEAQLGERERLSSWLTEAEAKAETLRRAVLGAAMSGRLVTQSSSDFCV
jgi:type I restriction enzyme S subunit